MYNDLVPIQVTRSCGCCTAILWFRDEQVAEQAFEFAGLTADAQIRDDLGDTYHVDSYPGYLLMRLDPSTGEATFSEPRTDDGQRR